ncbi:MAG: ATP-dependent protease subunit HslV [Clostridia bacterium]|nr:ATP-dependent protease subunit HslV [Clostridia bacterium]
MSIQFRGTTICGVRKNGQIAIAGDGQVTMGENVIFKSTARKVRRIYDGKVVIGFAGTVSDAFTLSDKFEEKLQQCGGNLERAAVAVAQLWHGDQGMRQLESLMIVADADHLLILSGTGEVITPDGDVAAIGSGGNYALAAARALVDNTDLSAHEIAEKALHIAASICIYTNDNIIVEDV